MVSATGVCITGDIGVCPFSYCDGLFNRKIKETVLSVGIGTYPFGSSFRILRIRIMAGIRKQTGVKQAHSPDPLAVTRFSRKASPSRAGIQEDKKRTATSPSREVYGCPVFRSLLFISTA